MGAGTALACAGKYPCFHAVALVMKTGCLGTFSHAFIHAMLTCGLLPSEIDV